MNKRLLGHSGIEVSPLGMGCWAIGGPWQFLDIQAGWGEVDDDEFDPRGAARAGQRYQLLRHGGDLWHGTQRTHHRPALASKRDEVVIATKLRFNVDETAKHAIRFRDGGADHRQCAGSLRTQPAQSGHGHH